MSIIIHQPESILSAASKHSEKNRCLYPVKYCKMQCIIDELKKKSCLVTAEVMKLGFPHTPPQYFQLSPIFPTHHMLCTLSSPPLPELLFPFHELNRSEHFLLCCRVKVVLLSWTDAAFQMPEEARECSTSPTLAPPAPNKFCFNHSVLLRPLQGGFKSAPEVPEKHN